MLTSLAATRPGPPGHFAAFFNFFFLFERGALGFSISAPLGSESGYNHQATDGIDAIYMDMAATAEPVTTRSAHGGPISPNQIIFERYERTLMKH